jgi:hypothetical protein
MRGEVKIIGGLGKLYGRKMEKSARKTTLISQLGFD